MFLLVELVQTLAHHAYYKSGSSLLKSIVYATKDTGFLFLNWITETKKPEGTWDPRSPRSPQFPGPSCYKSISVPHKFNPRGSTVVLRASWTLAKENCVQPQRKHPMWRSKHLDPQLSPFLSWVPAHDPPVPPLSLLACLPVLRRVLGLGSSDSVTPGSFPNKKQR